MYNILVLFSAGQARRVNIAPERFQGSNVEVFAVSKANRIKNEKTNAPVSDAVVSKGMSPLLKKILIWLLVAVIVLGSAGILIINAFRKNDTLIRRADGIIVDGVTYKASEVDYYYNLYRMSLYSTAYSYYSAYGLDVYGIDFSKSLFKQAYTKDSDEDGTPDFDTWGDYVLDQAIDTFYSYTVMNNEARDSGFLDTPGLQDVIDRNVAQTIADTKAEAEENGASYLTYLRYYYGNTVTEESYEAAVRRECIANYYSTHLYNSIEIEDWKIDEEYKDNTADYDTVTFRTFTVKVELDEHLDENGEKYSDDATKEADEKKITEATLALKEALREVKTEADFEALAREYNYAEGDAEDKVYAARKEDTANSSLSESEVAILFADDNTAGQTFVNADKETLSAYYFISRDTNHYATRSFRHILLSSEEKDDAVAAQAQELLDSWLNGEKTEKAFAALATENTDDYGSMLEGGLIDRAGRGTVVSEISDWLYDSERAEGDTAVIFTENYGYHIVYYCGEDDTEYWQVLCDQTLREAEYDTIADKLLSTHSYKTLDGLDRIN